MTDGQISDSADLTVYDLAEKMARGQPLTDVAHREVAAELVKLRDRILAIAGKSGSAELPALREQIAALAAGVGG
ncbi:MAG: hypothetical protein WKG01_02280 [Kofleriaceae bacterium]